MNEMLKNNSILVSISNKEATNTDSKHPEKEFPPALVDFGQKAAYAWVKDSGGCQQALLVHQRMTFFCSNYNKLSWV